MHRTIGTPNKKNNVIITKVTLVCSKCEYQARRRLHDETACRGVHETSCEMAICPFGHGRMVRKDGRRTKHFIETYFEKKAST